VSRGGNDLVQASIGLTVIFVWIVSVLAALGLPVVIIWAIIRLVARYT
jgi:hypothetical protein